MKTVQNELLLGVLDTVGLAALIVDTNDRVVEANGACGRLLGAGIEELRGRDIASLLDPACFPGPRLGPLTRTRCTRVDGGSVPVEISVIPLEEGALSVVVVRDLSGQRIPDDKAGRRKREFSVFSKFSEVLNRDTNRERILQESIEALPGLLGGFAAWAHLGDRDTGLVLKAFSGPDEALVAGVRGLKAGECLSGRVLASGRPLLARNVVDDPRVTMIDAEVFGVEVLAAVPIASRGMLKGVVAVAGKRAGDFSSADVQLLVALGNQLGVALENAELIKQLREKMNHIELTNELSGTINSSLSIGTIFRIMVSEIRKFIQYDRASLLLYEEEQQRLGILALDTTMNTVMKKGVKAPLEGTSAGWVVRNNRPWINRDLAENAAFPCDGRLRDEGIRSTVSIPLQQDKMLGVFNLDSREPGRYSEQDLQVLLPAARHISIALENALLFEEISKEKKEWERTFDAITDMVWIEDLRRRVMRGNRALMARTGLSGAQAAAVSCTDLLARIGLQEEGCICCETVATSRQSYREVVGADGSIFHFWAYPLTDDDGELYAVVHYLKDVTERRRLEQQLIRADKLASLGTLVAGIAHEINNPLGIIAGYSEALLERSGEESLARIEAFGDFPEYLRTIHNEIFRCKEILSSLLEFARPHSKRVRELNVNEIIKEVILLVNHRAKRLHCSIEQDLDRDLPPLCGEAGSLRQLFMNVIINAMYHTPEGGTIRIRTLPDAGRERSGTIRVEISDDGPGIPRTIVNKIFDPFFTTKPVGEGTGLGLAICHRIAEEHLGTIDVESEQGAGATFVVRLPAKGADRCDPRGAEDPPEERGQRG